MYILNDNTQNRPLDYYYWLKRLDAWLNEPTNQNLINVPKDGKLMNKKTLL